MSDQSLLARLDPRGRVLAAAGFALVVVASPGLAGPAAGLALAVALALAARLPAAETARKLAALDGFMALALVMLPFTAPGPAWGHLGPLAFSREGVEEAARILLKGDAVALAVLALVGPLEPDVGARALGRLGVPEKLVRLFLFTVRYLDLLGREYARLRLAMRARAFRLRANAHGWRTLGLLFGMLMVRSIERAERIVQAMRCRGFDGHFHPFAEDTRFGRADGIFAGVGLAALGGMLGIAFGPGWP